MSRKLFKVANFHGGLDETSSPVDMKNGYFTALTDVMVDKIGQIVPMGDFDVTPTHNPTSTAFLVHSGNPGYGLFAFNSNRRLNGTFTDCVIYVVCKYISSDEGENFIFWDSVGNSWAAFADSGNNGDLSSHALDLRKNDLAGQMHPDFFAWNGVLRICDGNMANITDANLITFEHDTYRGWVGYVKRTHFPGAAGNIQAAYADWYGYKSVHPVAPTAGIVSSKASGMTDALDASGGSSTTIVASNLGANLENDLTAANDYLLYQDGTTHQDATEIEHTADGVLTIQSSGTWVGSNPTAGTDFRLYPPIGAGVVLALTAADTGGFLLESNYTFGSTFVYDGHQESPIYEMTNGYGTGDGVYAIGSGDVGKFSGYAHFYGPYYPRISGMRIYYQYSEDVDDKWYMAWDIDFTRGSRLNLADDTFTEDAAGVPFTRDALTDGTDASGAHHTLPDLLLPGESYEAINGYGPKEDIDIRYATSAAVGNLVFVGNVYKKVAGIARHYPDRIYRCALPTYTGLPAVDVFPETFWIENPGVSDPIVKLIGFGNQLLAFGVDFLTVYTITAQGESITGTFAGYGIDMPCQAIKTPNGVIFANNSGVFIWNGQQAVNLLYKRGNA